jgi:hypothetical protein
MIAPVSSGGAGKKNDSSFIVDTKICKTGGK